MSDKLLPPQLNLVETFYENTVYVRQADGTWLPEKPPMLDEQVNAWVKETQAWIRSVTLSPPTFYADPEFPERRMAMTAMVVLYVEATEHYDGQKEASISIS